VIDALMRVQLDTEVPVLSLVLTPQQFHEHETHRTFFRDHFITKGEEAAVACVATLVATRRLKESAVDVREGRQAETRPALSRN
jgi:6,7-dimethyl-8-ribityllumazine synthase